MRDHIEVWTVTMYGEDGIDFPFSHAFHTKEEAVTAATLHFSQLYGPDTTLTANDNNDDAMVLTDPDDDVRLYITKLIINRPPYANSPKPHVITLHF